MDNSKVPLFKPSYPSSSIIRVTKMGASYISDKIPSRNQEKSFYIKNNSSYNVKNLYENKYSLKKIKLITKSKPKLNQ